MRFAWAPLLVSLVSCRAACGLDELAGAGGSGAGGGSTSTDASTSSAGGGGGAGGAGLAGGGGAGAAVGSLLCADEFPEVTPPPDPEPADCLVLDVGCLDSGTGGAGGATACSGTWSIEGGHFRITPGPLTGFWNGWRSLYLHTTAPVPGGEAFIARTSVQTRRSGGSEAWPEQPFQLAGLVVSASTDAEFATNWFKAEFGTLLNASVRGLRTVRRMGGSPLTDPGTDLRIVDHEQTTPPAAPPWVEVAVCRIDTGTVHAFYRPEGETWIQVGPTGGNNPPFDVPVYVGLVAASGNDPADLVALFDYFELVEVPSFAEVGDCMQWLDDPANLP